MQEQTAVRFLTNLLGIYSPSGNEEEIALFIAKKMSQFGFQVGVDTVGNVIGVVGEGEPVILLCGHMDTVAGYLPLRVEEGKIYARGAVDAKGPLASMIVAAAEAAKDPEFEGRVLVASVIEEEATSRGIRHLIHEGIEADYAIFGEPSGVENVTIGYKGQIQLKIICKTLPGHSSSPWLYQNALDEAYKLWTQINSSYKEKENPDSHFYSVTACLTKLSGGNATSVIPFEAEMFIDIRVPPPLTTTEVFEQTQKIINQYQNTHPQVAIKASVQDTVEPFEIHKANPLVHTLASSIRQATGKPATLLRKTGTGDMNILGLTMNLPIVTYGPGDSHLDHTVDEHIDIKDYLDAIQIYKQTILKLAKLYKRNKENGEDKK
ncbi:MAG: M20/M25/M40 family metallo-hydrolase [Candidatus Bathyarchaeota archaeon]|nr:M20/M25/M40 family metallo-hydrolase [Candidatus Bathyarchaeota archaeon]